jgi:hypothetical protein
MAQERSHLIKAPLGYSDDFGSSKNHPELEAILGQFENMRFRTRMLDAVTIEVEMARIGIPDGISSKKDRSQIFSAPAASSMAEMGDILAPLLGLEPVLDDDFRVLMRIEHGRYLQIQAIKDDMSVHLNFIGREE